MQCAICNVLPTQVKRLQSNVTQVKHSRIAWYKINETITNRYRSELSECLKNVQLEEAIVSCNNVLCEDGAHREQINTYCAELIDICIRTGRKCFPKVQSGRRCMPYWSTRVQHLKEEALLWSKRWKECGRPCHGEIAECMRRARHAYHYEVRWIKRNENNLRKVRMAECIVNNNDRDLWKEIKKSNRSRRGSPAHIDGLTKCSDIADLFARKSYELYNSVPSNESVLAGTKNDISNKMYNYRGDEHNVKVEKVAKAVRNLKCEKSDGEKGLFASHVILAPDIYHIHLSLLLRAMNVHGFTPDDMLCGTLVYLPKDRDGDLCDSDNYRGICLCSCITKVYESVFVSRYSKQLETSNLKLKEVATYYLNRDSSVYACFIDASKAFDRVRYMISFLNYYLDVEFRMSQLDC